MSNFRSYLLKYLSTSSIPSYEKEVRLYNQWFKANHLNLTDVRHRDIMAYIRYCRENNNEKRTINLKLKAIQYYYQFHGITPNPCAQIRLRGIRKTIPKNLLTQYQIDFIYQNYPEKSLAQIRNKVILGLLCYQAMTTGEVLRLEKMDIHVDVGYVRIRPGKKSNARTLKIDEAQRLVLQQYDQQIRKLLLDQSELDTTLFIVNAGSGHTLSAINQLVAKLKALFSDFKNTHQLRASVIRNWLKSHNLREAQYMAGHRYISSTERYCENYIEDLQKKLDQYHPLSEQSNEIQ